MAIITLAGKRDTETTATENVRQLSDTDYNRVAYWAANKYFPQGVVVPGTPEVPAAAAVLDENGDVITPETEYQPAVPASVRNPTGYEVFQALTDEVYNNIKRECESWYLQKAEEAARASVAPIVLVEP